MVENHSKWWSLILFGGGTVIALLASFIIKEELKKTRLGNEEVKKLKEEDMRLIEEDFD